MGWTMSYGEGASEDERDLVDTYNRIQKDWQAVCALRGLLERQGYTVELECRSPYSPRVFVLKEGAGCDTWEEYAGYLKSHSDRRQG